METLNVKAETKQAFRDFKRKLQIDLDKDLTDDEAQMYVFSNFARHVYEDGKILWHLSPISKEPDGEEEQPISQ
jgi:hypothetical protein